MNLTPEQEASAEFEATAPKFLLDGERAMAKHYFVAGHASRQSEVDALAAEVVRVEQWLLADARSVIRDNRSAAVTAIIEKWKERQT